MGNNLPVFIFPDSSGFSKVESYGMIASIPHFVQGGNGDLLCDQFN